MNELFSNYGHKTRVRACVIVTHDNSVLMTGHKGMHDSATFWSPPGGGIHFGESSESAAIREVLEETGIELTNVTALSFISEFIASPLHAIELFFWADLPLKPLPVIGYDPEFQQPLLTHVEWMPFEQINALPNDQKHHLFHQFHSLESLLKANGIISYIK